jgi:uncharacterized protein YajQ (UPF0234 family)
MPSMDVVSEIDKQEIKNAVDQTTREVATRWDFKGHNVSLEMSEYVVTLIASTEFQLDQMAPIFEGCLIKRKIKVSCLEYGDVKGMGKQVKRPVTLRQGLDKPLAQKVVKIIKNSQLKVQAAIQGEMVRVTGKKRDDLQQVMQLLRSDDSIELPLQFKNLKD